jgi:hypothetical protein
MNDSKMAAERRELVIAGALVRHQLREYLYAHRILWREIREDPPNTAAPSTFIIDATPEQWESINQWVEKVKQ